jgi:hypothetical protein
MMHYSSLFVLLFLNVASACICSCTCNDTITPTPPPPFHVGAILRYQFLEGVESDSPGLINTTKDSTENDFMGDLVLHRPATEWSSGHSGIEFTPQSTESGDDGKRLLSVGAVGDQLLPHLQVTSWSFWLWINVNATQREMSPTQNRGLIMGFGTWQVDDNESADFCSTTCKDTMLSVAWCAPNYIFVRYTVTSAETGLPECNWVSRDIEHTSDSDYFIGVEVVGDGDVKMYQYTDLVEPFYTSHSHTLGTIADWDPAAKLYGGHRLFEVMWDDYEPHNTEWTGRLLEFGFFNRSWTEQERSAVGAHPPNVTK